MSEERHPWERLPGESEQAFAAFRRYRDAAPEDRTIAKAAGPGARTGKIRTTEKWSSEFRWRERVAAYLDYNESVALEVRRQAIIEMERRHVAVARNAMGLVAAKIRDLASEGKLPKTLEGMTLFQVARLMEAASRVERNALGHAPPRERKRDNSAALKELADMRERAKTAGDVRTEMEILRMQMAIADGQPVTVTAGDWKAGLEAMGLKPEAWIEDKVAATLAAQFGSADPYGDLDDCGRSEPASDAR